MDSLLQEGALYLICFMLRVIAALRFMHSNERH